VFLGFFLLYLSNVLFLQYPTMHCTLEITDIDDDHLLLFCCILFIFGVLLVFHYFVHLIVCRGFDVTVTVNIVS